MVGRSVDTDHFGPIAKQGSQGFGLLTSNENPTSVVLRKPLNQNENVCQSVGGLEAHGNDEVDTLE
jgi:hypothetical protein